MDTFKFRVLTIFVVLTVIVAMGWFAMEPPRPTWGLILLGLTAFFVAVAIAVTKKRSGQLK
ncbi:MAG: hypothetical protein AABN95_18190 [Acidobacteriota bacterium]